jgi:hypothetical protein
VAKQSKNQKYMDAVVVGSVEWQTAREAAFRMAAVLHGEISALTEAEEIKDAYSPVAWTNICRQLRVVTDGMVTMRLLAEGKTNETITEETGIPNGSIAAYKAWNTMYSRQINRTIRLRMEKDRVRQADLDFLRSIGISVSVPEEVHDAH